jgi:hypothetical protein
MYPKVGLPLVPEDHFCYIILKQKFPYLKHIDYNYVLLMII